MICYHHTDMDGKSAGWLVHTLHPSTIEDFAESYIPTNYGDKFDKHTEKDDVFIVDVSISATSYNDFLNVCKTARTVTWIDHHQTSLDIIKEHEDELQAIDNLTYFVSKCACGAALTYTFFNIPRDYLSAIRQISENEKYLIKADYLKGGIISVNMRKMDPKHPEDALYHCWKVTLPKWLFHVDDYDTWKQIDPLTNTLILGVDTEDTNLVIDGEGRNSERKVFNSFWNKFTTDMNTISEYIAYGKSIDRYIKSKYARELGSTFEWEYNGTKFICKNAHGNSWNFGELIKNYPAAILFNYDGKSGKWDYSVYSDESSNFDCSAFCKLFGGGGHIHASGFQIKDLIFLKTPRKTDNIIFLGGTVDDNWRTKFISEWNKVDNKKISLFDPVVDDWNDKAREKENEIKSKAKLNLFVITHNQKGVFSFAEIVECAHYSKVFFAILDEHNQIDKVALDNYDCIGKLIEKHDGIYKVYDSNSGIKSLVDDVIAAI